MANEEKRLDDLFSRSEMGDSKLSEFYRDMLQTVGALRWLAQVYF